MKKKLDKNKVNCEARQARQGELRSKRGQPGIEGALRYKGFTLIELLVAIAIIGILSVMGFASFTQAQKKARNSRRKADLRAIQNAQEQYMSDNGSYIIQSGVCGTSIPDILAIMPGDPKPGFSYSCAGDANAYCAIATLEDDSNGNCSGCSCVVGSCSFATANTESFCVKNLQ